MILRTHFALRTPHSALPPSPRFSITQRIRLEHFQPADAGPLRGIRIARVENVLKAYAVLAGDLIAIGESNGLSFPYHFGVARKCASVYSVVLAVLPNPPTLLSLRTIQPPFSGLANTVRNSHRPSSHFAPRTGRPCRPLPSAAPVFTTSLTGTTHWDRTLHPDPPRPSTECRAAFSARRCVQT